VTPGHADFGSLAYWGGIVCGLGGLILAGMSVSEVKRARNSLRRVIAQGRITYAEDTINKFGDVIGKVVDVAFTTANGTRIKFTENVDERYYADQQEVTVHYDPAHPRDTATVYTRRAAFTRAFWFAASSLFLFVLFVSTVYFHFVS
jgi:hypothetical protein